jgi:Zn-dependent peptidase ImmA (M78 family)
VNPILIKWAREQAGLGISEAASALELSAPEKLLEIETGAKPPSRPVLLRMVKTYRRPLLFFYLDKPPLISDKGHDFRTLPPDRVVRDDFLVETLLRQIKARQDLVKSLVVDEEESGSLSFVKSVTPSDSPLEISNSIQRALGFDLAEYRCCRSVEEAFDYIRNKAEEIGIFVLLIGNLGSHHTAISARTYRGFAIADEFAPFVVINDQDTKIAWPFTLLHELAHIWLGQDGISGGYSENRIEKICNQIASNILLPDRDIGELNLDGLLSNDDLLNAISEFARARHLSIKMVALKLLNLGKIKRASWDYIDQKIDQSILSEKESARAKKDGSTGPSFYVVRRHRLGSSIVNLVARNLSSGSITPVKAAKILGVRPRSVAPLVNKAA